MSQNDAIFETHAEGILRLEQLGPTTFHSAHLYDNSTGVIFGGQLLAQALLAGRRTTPDWPANSCTAYFLRPGRLDATVEYEVETVRDGRSFASRRVVARQGGKALFDMLCSFRQAGTGPSHQVAMPANLPQAEELPDIQDYLRANSDRIPLEEVAAYFLPLPVQFRLIDAGRTFHLEGVPGRSRDFWMRYPTAERVRELNCQQPLIAFMSDFFIGPVVNDLRSPPFPRRVPVLTLSHSITFHSPARADDWLLYRVESPWAGEGIGFSRGLLFDRNGSLVASTFQEVLMSRTASTGESQPGSPSSRES